MTVTNVNDSLKIYRIDGINSPYLISKKVEELDENDSVDTPSNRK